MNCTHNCYYKCAKNYSPTLWIIMQHKTFTDVNTSYTCMRAKTLCKHKCKKYMSLFVVVFYLYNFFFIYYFDLFVPATDCVICNLYCNLIYLIHFMRESHISIFFFGNKILELLFKKKNYRFTLTYIRTGWSFTYGCVVL